MRLRQEIKMIRKGRLLHRDSWWIKDFTDALEYVKMVLDSESPPDKEMNTTSGRRLLIGEYSILNKNTDERNRKRLADAIIKLLDDPEYSCDAIPAAAELGIVEAKDWFLKLTEKSVQELREIRTSDFTNGLGCLTVYAYKINELIPYLEHLISNNKVATDEKLSILDKIGNHNPDFILNSLEAFISEIVSYKGKEHEKITVIKFLTSGIFKKYGDGYCIDLAKRFKENLPKEYQLLFYKALSQNPTPRFKPYLEELKKILAVNE